MNLTTVGDHAGEQSLLVHALKRGNLGAANFLLSLGADLLWQNKQVPIERPTVAESLPWTVVHFLPPRVRAL